MLDRAFLPPRRSPEDAIRVNERAKNHSIRSITILIY
jgi:hypothetical protein